MTVRREFIGGPADGAKVDVATDLMDIRVLCTITPSSDAFRPSGLNPSFQCLALYAIRTTSTGAKHFHFQSITK